MNPTYFSFITFFERFSKTIYLIFWSSFTNSYIWMVGKFLLIDQVNFSFLSSIEFKNFFINLKTGFLAHFYL